MGFSRNEIWVLQILLILFFQTPIFSQDVSLPNFSPISANVSGIEAVKIDLNGIWQFNPNTQGNYSGRKGIKVPGEWLIQGFNVEPKTRAGYARTFQVPADWESKTFKLRCDGIYSDALIYIIYYKT